MNLVVPRSSRLAGMVTAAELTAAGVSRAQLRRLLSQGSLVSVARGVYAPAARAAGVAGSPHGDHALRLAALLALAGPGVVGSHHSAALVHGLDLLGRESASGLTVTRPPGGMGSRTGPRGVRVLVAALPAGHTTIRNGVRVTSVARTVVDLARASPVRAGVVLADSALHRRRTSKAELWSVIAACSRWSGVGRAREVVEFSDGRAESPFESLSRVVFRVQGLPPPDLQARVGDDNGVAGRVDFLWKEHRTVGEADGAIKYADPGRARAQLERDARLRQAGFEVVHFTWAQLVTVPGQVAAEIREAFRRGGR